MERAEHRNARVLIVDDQEEIHADFRELLKPGFMKLSTDALATAFLPKDEEVFQPEFDLQFARSGEEALDIVVSQKGRNCPFAVAYVDIRMPPGIDGIETIRRIRAVDEEVEVVIMTAYADKSLSEIVQGMELLHKLLYIRKPFAREEIQQITLSLVEKWNVERELAAGRRRVADGHRRLRAVLDATGDAIAMYDLDSRLVFANRWYETLLDATERELRRMSPEAVGARLGERLREYDLHRAEEGNLREDGGKWTKPAGADRAPGKRPLQRSIQPVRDGAGDMIGNVVVYRDVSGEVELERMTAEVRRLRAELETTSSFAEMVGATAGIQQVQALIGRAMASDITVLVQGESGTGKELVARLLHFNGPRRAAPFLAVNCAAVSESLIESELFGHERGAFTGATSRKLGVFERANGGTILLDEIGDMSPALQAKLLRVLQEREIQRVGGTAAVPVDVRVVAATNANLETAIRAGAFREDLFYRIAVFPIVVPPLRERREDIPLLAEHFLRKHARGAGRSIRALSPGALRRLEQHDWPGNVRELDSAIGRAVLLETTPVLQEGNLPPKLLSAAPDHQVPPALQGVVPLAEVERRAVVHALEVSARNVTRAARALGINRTTLHRKLNRYGLSGGD